MDSSKALQEQIDDLAIEARAIMEVASKESREPNEAETNRFDEITDTLLPGLKERLATAAKREEKILELSKQNQRQSKMEELAGILSQSAGRPRKVLPTNGELGDEGEPQDRVYVRSAKLKAFKNEREAFDAGMWYRAIVSNLYNRNDVTAIQHCHRRGFDVSNSAYEGSGAAGGYLVPPQISQTIIDVRERVGIARQVCQIQPMTSDMVSIPKRAGGLTVYYPSELGSITDSDKSWAQIALAAQKRAVASKISQELVDDALISIVDNVVSEQAYALALREDTELISGDGTSTYGGVVGLKSAVGSAGTYTCDANENLWSEIDLEDIMAAMAKLPDRFNRSPVWICSSNFYWAVFARLLAAGGGNTIGNLQVGPGMTKSFLGVPVLTTSTMPTADADSAIHALFGQFDMAVVLGDRTGIRVGRDDSVGFLSDYTTLKATSRYDIKVHEPGDSSNAGAYIALKTNAA